VRATDVGLHSARDLRVGCSWPAQPDRAPDADHNDKRIRLVHLTELGRQAASQVSAARAERFGQLLDAIEESKRPHVLEALHLLKDAANAIH